MGARSDLSACADLAGYAINLLTRQCLCFFFFSSRRRHTRLQGDWSSDVCSSDLIAAARTLEAIKSVPGVAEPNSSEEGDIPQLDVRVDRQEAWRAGLGVGSVAATLQPLFSGQRATTWEDPQGFSHDVMVLFPDSLRGSAEDVSSLPVASTFTDARNGLPSMVPLSQVAEVRAGIGPQQIERRQLEQQVQI